MTTLSTHNQITYILIILATLSSISTAIQLNQNHVYSISYVRTYNPDLILKSLGCNYNIAYSSFTFPDGIRDAAHIVLNPYQYGVRCQAKQMYIKVFGYAQDYQLLRDPNIIVQSIKRSLNGKNRINIIVDWKQNDGDLKSASALLDNLLQLLVNQRLTVYLKVPASFLCKIVDGKPYILGLSHASKIIVEMYGEQPSEYKTINQIFLSQYSQSYQTIDYPQTNCPKFPSYSLLKRRYPNIEFYIEKTLQQQEYGYLGEQFQPMLKSVPQIYTSKIFFDDYPPNIIRL